MIHFRDLSILFAAITASAYAEQNPFPFCDAGQIRRQLESARSYLRDEDRFREMDQTYHEVAILRKEMIANAQAPKAYTKNCLAKKQELMELHAAGSTTATRDKFPFHFIVGQYLELLGRKKEAFDHYREAATRDKTDYMAPYRAYKMWVDLFAARIELARQTSGTTTPKDLDEVMSETNGLLAALVQNPKTPKTIKIEAFQHRARLLSTLDRDPESMGDWRQILALDPHNTTALTKLASFEFHRGRKAEAQKYMETLAALAPERENLLKQLLEMQLDDENYAAALKTSQVGIEKHPQDPEMQAYHALALAGNDRLAEASKIGHDAYLKAPQSKVARKAEANNHFLAGQAWSKKNFPGKAFAEFQQALKLNPDSRALRVQIAKLLYEEHEETKFEPAEAAAHDLDEAVNLLDPVVKASFVEQRTLEVYISSCAHSSKPNRGAAGCDRYREDFGSYPTFALVMDCAHIYKGAGQAEKARKSIQGALADPRFQSTRSQLTTALTQMR